MIKNELKKEITLKGLNTLTNVRKLPDGFHPYIKNFFQYDFGTLEKRKGIKYLNAAYTNASPFWHLSDDPIQVGTYTVENDGYGNKVFTKGVVNPKIVPISNVGIGQILNQTYYNPFNNDEIIYTIQNKTFLPTDLPDDIHFAAAEDATSGSYTSGTYEYKLFYKLAAGLGLAGAATAGGKASAVVSGTNVSVKLTWDALTPTLAALVQYYVLYIKIVGDFIPCAIVDATATSIVVSDDPATPDPILPCHEMPGIADYTIPFSCKEAWAVSGAPVTDTDWQTSLIGAGIYIWKNTMPFPTQLFCKIKSNDMYLFTYPQSFFHMGDMHEANGALYIPTAQIIEDSAATGFDVYINGSEDNTLHGITYRYIGACEKYSQAAQGCGHVVKGAANFAPPPANKMTVYRDQIILANDNNLNYPNGANISSNRKVYHSEQLAGNTLSCFAESGSVNFFSAGQTTIIEAREDDSSGIEFLDTLTRTGSVTDVSTYLFIGRKNNIYMIEGTWNENATAGTIPYISSDFMLHRIGNVGTTKNNALLLTKIGYVFANNQGLFGLSMEGNHSTLSEMIKNVFGDRNTFMYQREGLPQVYNKNNLDPIVRVLVRIDNYDDYCIVYEAWMDLRDSQNVNWFNINSYKLPYVSDAVVPKVNSLPIDVYNDDTGAQTVNNLSNPNLFWSINGFPIVFDAGYNDLGNAIDSEFISAEYDFDYANLMKSFHATGITVETDDLTSLYMQIIEETGQTSLQNIYETMVKSHALWDNSTWDISQWGGRNYEYRKVFISPPPVGRTGRLVLVHNELDKNIKIINLEIFFKMLRRGIMT